MGNCCEKNTYEGFFPGDELILNDKDRRLRVDASLLNIFPFNTIGWIQSQ
jgi:hypothetical protein